MTHLPQSMPWCPEYETGLPEIDAHHRRLLGLLNEALRAVAEGSEWRTERALQDIFDFARIHFELEESLMRAAGYPDIEAHLREHHGFRNHMGCLYQDFLQGREEVREGFIHFLQTWLREHILGSDMRYVAALKQRPEQT